jgi:fibronectin type 3 domain-containing protein
MKTVILVGVLLSLTACGSGGDSAPAVPPTTSPATASLTVGWDPNQENDLSGYRLYQGTAPGRYGAPIATLTRTSTSHVIGNLQRGATYYFAVAAFDNAGNEGPLSNEISRTIP